MEQEHRHAQEKIRHSAWVENTTAGRIEKARGQYLGIVAILVVVGCAIVAYALGYGWAGTVAISSTMAVLAAVFVIDRYYSANPSSHAHQPSQERRPEAADD